MSKAKARHSALQDLAKMIMPNLLSDVAPKKKEEVKKKAKQIVEEPEVEAPSDDVEEEPKVVSMSLTRLMGNAQEPKRPMVKKQRKKVSKK